MSDFFIEKCSGKWPIYVDGERILRCDTRRAALHTVRVALELMQQPAGADDWEEPDRGEEPSRRLRSASPPPSRPACR